MEDITIIFTIGSCILLLVQYYLKSPPVYLLGEVFGMGGLYQVIQEVQADTMDSQVGLLMSLVSIMAIIYSAMNLIMLWTKYSRK